MLNGVNTNSAARGPASGNAGSSFGRQADAAGQPASSRSARAGNPIAPPSTGTDNSGLASRSAAPIGYNAGANGSSAAQGGGGSQGEQVTQTLLGATYVFPSDSPAPSAPPPGPGDKVVSTNLGVTYVFPFADDAPLSQPPGTTPVSTNLGFTFFVPNDAAPTGATETTQTSGDDDGQAGPLVDESGDGLPPEVANDLRPTELTPGPVQGPAIGGDTGTQTATTEETGDDDGGNTADTDTGRNALTVRISQDENGNPVVMSTGDGDGELEVNGNPVEIDGAPDVPVEDLPPPRMPNDSRTPSATFNDGGNPDNVTARINGNEVQEGDEIFEPQEPIDTTPAGPGNSEGVVESNGFVIGTQGNDTLVSTDPDNDIFNGQGGDDVLIGGAGDDRMSGGEGVDTFTINQDGGRDIINDFDPAAGEVINLNVDGINSLSDLLNTAPDPGGRAVFDLGNGNSLDLRVVQISELSAANFNFNAA